MANVLALIETSVSGAVSNSARRPVGCRGEAGHPGRGRRDPARGRRGPGRGELGRAGRGAGLHRGVGRRSAGSWSPRRPPASRPRSRRWSRPPCWSPTRSRAARWPPGWPSAPAAGWPDDAVDVRADGARVLAVHSVFGGAYTVESAVRVRPADHHRAPGRRRGPRRRGRGGKPPCRPSRSRPARRRDRVRVRGRGRDRPARTARGGQGGLRRARPGLEGELRAGRAARRRAGRGRGRLPRGRGRRLHPAVPPGRARPASPFRRSCTWRWASPGRSSTGPACRRPRRSWRSTRTRTRRSSRSPTSASWATCLRLFPS